MQPKSIGRSRPFLRQGKINCLRPPNADVGRCGIRRGEMEHSSEKVLKEQTSEEIIEIDENGVVHAVGRTGEKLKTTVLRDPEGEY